jgi:3-hydroxy-9,10-secoandrosta-1,3,5(10)-triene-9,17-dione monooxygenase reductase component
MLDAWLGDHATSLSSMYDVQWRPGRDDRTAPGDEQAVQAAAAAARRFRDVLGRFASGVTVVTSRSGGAPVGLTCQSFSSVSLDPPLVLFVPSTSSRSWPLIQQAGSFAVNVLAEGQQELSNRMAGGADDKFAGVGWSASEVTGNPLLDGTVAWIDCTIEAVHPGGDHDVVIGRVVDLGAGDAERPLLFHRGRYHSTDTPPEA